MKTIVFSHYTVKNITTEPWVETWTNLVHFAETMTPHFKSINIRIKLRKVIMDNITQDSLMAGNMVTLAIKDIQHETPIEKFIMMETDFVPCISCVTPDKYPFPCRALKNVKGETVTTLTDDMFLAAALKLAFKVEHDEYGDTNYSECTGHQE